jgi:hypothetical protein
VTREQVAHPTLSVPILFPCRCRIHTFASQERSAPWPCPAVLLPCRQSVLTQPDAAVACCSQILPPALTRLSRPAGDPESSPLLHALQGSLRSQDSILAAVPPSSPEATIFFCEFTIGHHWEGFIQDVASAARKKPAARLSEAQAQ